MPHANRGQPDGCLGTLPARGAFMGNRGCLHDAAGRIVRNQRGRARITCTLNPKPGRGPVPLFAPGHYTPLFFLDEAVAAAAGHRPCAECRRSAYRTFQNAWAAAFGTLPSAPQINDALHLAVHAPRAQALANSLPTGAFYLHQGQPHLIRDGAALAYLGHGYGPALSPPDEAVELLTPAPLIAVMRAGWQPAFSAAEDRPNW